MVVALQPVPFLDILLITPIQIGLVQGIGRLRGYHLGKKSALEIFRALRTSLTTEQLAIVGGKLVPTLGWLFSASVAYSMTYAFGELMDYYFRVGRSMLPAEMRETLKKQFYEKWKQVYAQKRDMLRAKLGRPFNRRRTSS
jgi:uncharacterized protein (DUF697 family)